MPTTYDVVVVGAGPAGLSAALVLGRCLRRVLVCDGGRPRNARSTSLNGYLTRDGIPPFDFLRIGRGELAKYQVEQRAVSVRDVRSVNDTFIVSLENSEEIATLSVLLATGVRDHLPDIPGLAECYGTTVHHCPYCDGWEVRGRRLAALGEGSSPAGLALSLLTWSDRVMVCTNGSASARPTSVQRRKLAAHRIQVQHSRIAHFDHQDGHLRQIVFDDGTTTSCDAVFFAAPQSQQCELARQLGCEFTDRGTVKTDHLGRSCVSGIYVVGDASRDVQFAIVAASEGAKAGVAINKALQARTTSTLAGSRS